MTNKHWIILTILNCILFLFNGFNLTMGYLQDAGDKELVKASMIAGKQIYQKVIYRQVVSNGVPYLYMGDYDRHKYDSLANEEINHFVNKYCPE